MSTPAPQPTAPDRPRERKPRPLAAKLALMLTVLALLVLILAGVALTVLLKSFLLNRLDDQLAQTARVSSALLARDGDESKSADGTDEPREPHRERPGTVVLSDSLPGGTIAAFASAQTGVQVVTGPDAPRVTAAQLVQVINQEQHPGAAFSASIDGEDYRWLTYSDGGRSTITGVPLSPVEDTTERLIGLMLLVGAIALIGVAGGGFLVVRRGLKPLSRLAAGARAIAESDLGAPLEPGSGDAPERPRLELHQERSSAEVAELSTALSTMLAEIDDSIETRDAATARLRQFVADASHELRTPLAAISAYAELLRRGLYSDTAESELFLTRIESESNRMGSLVNDLLLLARLDQGRPLAQEPVDVLTIIDEAVNDLQAADPGRQVEVLIEPATEAMVIGDQDRLRQVFGNLLTNIRVHTATSAQVQIRVADVANRLIVNVKDSGPGIPADALDSIFDRFFRADPGRSRDSGGSGLGLAIVQSVVQAHGGTVQVSSSPTGTDVRVALPLPVSS